MSFLNYHHLRYFRAVAVEGSLTRAAERLNLSQSALSIQLRKLEESVGQDLFERRHKSLQLTEAGHIALEYAETIFRAGEEMMGTLLRQSPGRRQVLRIGAVATLSRNFQMQLIRPLLNRTDVEWIIRSGSFGELLGQLRAHNLDMLLSNLPARRDVETGWHSHLLNEQPVSLIGRPSSSRKHFRFPESLRDYPVILPSLESNIRSGFDLLMEQAGIRPSIAAEVDDMAMLRLLARDSDALTLVPRVVVDDELERGSLVEWHRIESIRESFYAITPSRRFPNPVLKELLGSARIHGGRDKNAPKRNRTTRKNK